MQKGKIIETGTHETLLADFPNGIYSKFIKEQENAEDAGDANDLKDNDAYKKAKAKTVKVVDKLELEMKEKADEIDEQRAKEDKIRIEALAKKSHFVRLLSYNKPRINIFFWSFGLSHLWSFDAIIWWCDG